jgi:hypothetical protein
MRVGIVACGYGDGYPRHAPTGTPVQVAGQRTRTLGRVSMDKICIDLSALPQKVGVGDTVTLWGGDRRHVPGGRRGGQRPAPSPTRCSVPWPRGCQWSKPTDGQGQDAVFLHRVRRQFAQVAGPVPRLRAVEHPGRGGGRTAAAGGRNFAALGGASGLQMLAEIRPREEPRQATGVEEFDRVLGGGLVAGGVVLIGGDPGIGKSTLLLQALARLAQPARTCLYVSGEESASRWRCARGACSSMSAHAVAGRDQPGKNPATLVKPAPRGRGDRLDPDRVVGRAAVGAGLGGAGARMRGAADALRQAAAPA